MLRRIPPVIVCFVSFLFAVQSAAGRNLHPDSVSFQGFVTNTGGVPINDTTNVTTKLYKGNTEVYSQLHSNVQITNGVFNVVIGPTDTLVFDQPMTVGIRIGTDPEINPRTPLQSVPYALSLRGLSLREVNGTTRVGVGVSSPDTSAFLDVGGPIHVKDGGAMLYTRTGPSGTPTDDGMRILYENDYAGPGGDYLVIEKTDVNGTDPDGGIVFINTGSDGGT